MSESRYPTITRHLPNPSTTQDERNARLDALEREAAMKRANDKLASRLPNPHTKSYPGPGKIARSPYDRIVKP